MRKVAGLIPLLVCLSCSRIADEPCCPAGAFCLSDELVFQDAQCGEPKDNFVTCVHLGDQRCHRHCLTDADCTGSVAGLDRQFTDGGVRGPATPYCVNVNFCANQSKPCLFAKRICLADPVNAGNTCP